MSYCRFSTDCYQCDVYVYESVYDCWTIHVAGRRHHNPTIPLVPADYDEANGFIEWYKRQQEWLTHPDTTLIDLPEDNEHVGKTYDLPSPEEAADMLQLISDSGLNVPEYVIIALREEQIEIDQQLPPGKE